MADRQSLPRLAKRLRIFMGEADEWHGRPLYRAILELLQQEGASGATVLHGIEGFGPGHHLSTERLPDISENLPIIIEVVESQERIEQLLPSLDHMVQHGTVTLTSVELVYPR